jgi:hypothetical protein
MAAVRGVLYVKPVLKLILQTLFIVAIFENAPKMS